MLHCTLLGGCRYDNITSTRLPWETVWTPDIVLYNAAGDGEQGREMRTLIQVDYQGNVTLLTQAIYMSKCKVGCSNAVCSLSNLRSTSPTIRSTHRCAS
jgi:hypothetical protein